MSNMFGKRSADQKSDLQLSNAKFIKDFMYRLQPDQTTDLFSEYTDAMFLQLVGFMRVLDLPEKGKELFGVGDPADTFYFVMQGKLLLTMPDNCTQMAESVGQGFKFDSLETKVIDQYHFTGQPEDSSQRMLTAAAYENNT